MEDLQDLWQMIVGLSYLGDVRMGLAEDSKKVERIATSSSEGLQEAYRPLLEVIQFVLHILLLLFILLWADL